MKLRVDLRDVPLGKLDNVISAFGDKTKFLMTAWQWSAWKSKNDKVALSERITVMVPDFLHYARLVSTGQAKDIIKLPGSAQNLLRSGLHCIPTGIAEIRGIATGNFWSGARALLAFDLGLLGSGFRGQVLLHYNLADFAWFFERDDFLISYFHSASRIGRAGISTQQISAALSCCSRWNTIPAMVLYTPGFSRPESLLIETAQTRQFAGTEWILDLTQWPDELLTNPEIHEMQKPYDTEWLLNHQSAFKVIAHV